MIDYALLKFAKPEKRKVREAIKSLSKPIFGIRKDLLKVADALWSKAVRESHKLCIWCQVRSVAHAHHIFSRKHYSTRHEMDNGAALCAGCHMKSHRDPTLFHDFIEHCLGYERYQTLKARAYIAGKRIDLQMAILQLQQLMKIEK